MKLKAKRETNVIDCSTKTELWFDKGDIIKLNLNDFEVVDEFDHSNITKVVTNYFQRKHPDTPKAEDWVGEMNAKPIPEKIANPETIVEQKLNMLIDAIEEIRK